MIFHSRFTALVAKVLPNSVSQRHIMPVDKANIVKSLRRLKSTEFSVAELSYTVASSVIISDVPFKVYCS